MLIIDVCNVAALCDGSADTTRLNALRQQFPFPLSTTARLNLRNHHLPRRPVTNNHMQGLRLLYVSRPGGHWERLQPKVRTVVKYTGYAAGLTVVGVFIPTSLILLHDAFTYRTKVCTLISVVRQVLTTG